MNFKDYIASIPDFPQEGVLFRDITPLMADGEAFKAACDKIIEFAKKVGAEVIVGPESRGFIFGCPVAYELGLVLFLFANQGNFQEKRKVFLTIWNMAAMNCIFTKTVFKKVRKF